MNCDGCVLQGNLLKCEKEFCGIHGTWYAIEQHKKINKLKAGILEALEWNWLSEDYPKDVAEKLFKLAGKNNA